MIYIAPISRIESEAVYITWNSVLIADVACFINAWIVVTVIVVVIIIIIVTRWWLGEVVSALASINEVNQRRARLVMR